jgi:hypothetical protein
MKEITRRDGGYLFHLINDPNFQVGAKSLGAPKLCEFEEGDQNDKEIRKEKFDKIAPFGTEYVEVGDTIVRDGKAYMSVMFYKNH